MKKRYVILIIATALLILLAGLFGIAALVITKYFGTEVKAVVVKLPVHCTSRSKITVQYANRQYELSITADGCRKGVFKIGQRITVMYHKGLDTVVFRGTGPEIVAVIMVILLVIIYFQYKDQVKARQSGSSGNP